jgi:hypothetical protein
MIEVDKDKLFGVIRELSNSMTRAESERDFQHEALKKAADDFQLEKKLISRLAKTYHKDKFSEEKASAEAFIDLYESVVK